jgi:hypothetical protein
MKLGPVKYLFNIVTWIYGLCWLVMVKHVFRVVHVSVAEEEKYLNRVRGFTIYKWIRSRCESELTKNRCSNLWWRVALLYEGKRRTTFQQKIRNCSGLGRDKRRDEGRVTAERQQIKQVNALLYAICVPVLFGKSALLKRRLLPGSLSRNGWAVVVLALRRGRMLSIFRRMFVLLTPGTWNKWGWRSVVSLPTRYGLGGPGIKSRWGRVFPHPFRMDLGLTQPPVQRVLGLFPGVKLPGRGVDHPPHI